MHKAKTVFAAAILVVVIAVAMAGAAYAHTLSQQATTSPRSIYEQLPGQQSSSFTNGPEYRWLGGNPLGVCRQNRCST